jgi:hypothetical protein
MKPAILFCKRALLQFRSEKMIAFTVGVGVTVGPFTFGVGVAVATIGGPAHELRLGVACRKMLDAE